TNDQLTRYHRDGFVVVEQLFDNEEADLLLKIALADDALSQPGKSVDNIDLTRDMEAQVISLGDGDGGETKFWVDDGIGDDYYSALACCRRIVDPMEQLLGGEVYHWHHKMMLKSARTGGAFMWHQDFGYWQQRGHCLFPFMASCMIAVNPATRENGCLQVLAGSQAIGLINHRRVDGQSKADPERVDAAVERLQLVHLELDPGSAVFFHCNLLHRSDANHSDHPRWTLICCYNAARNDPYRDSHHPRYRPLPKIEDARVVQIGRQQWKRTSA
ncbi:MAG: phytanoyl-CoA dioxygenase family protein, partial [Lentisphaeria bacterium]|nr:phytanoyl-CoA dioxygenase family protein [Lentisphaeria bacterium]